jgi:malate dehydrogenase (oxaloacetate-decarboxylating)
MEGKAILFKKFADVDAVPIVLSTQDPDEIIKIVEGIAPTFGGINLEDISAPNCFYIEETLKSRLNIPVFHDDQHGTAIVVLAGLINGLKLVNKSFDQIKVVISGAGAAGIAIGKLLHSYGVKHIIMLDSKGTIHAGRTDINKYKALFVETNRDNLAGDLGQALQGADVFVGVSKPDLLGEQEVSLMAEQSIIFALSNPTPEIMPDVAKQGGAYIVATGRSDFPNQINNVLAFPGIFKGALQARIPQITDAHKIAAAEALANAVENPNPEKIIPSPFDPGVADKVIQAVMKV